MKLPVYLDYAATTPVDKRVSEVMVAHLTQDGIFGNPASRSHLYGWQAEEAVENARAEVANLIASDTREIVWTSGATEANNLALKGVADTNGKNRKHIISSVVEHKSVLDTLSTLESQGFDVTYLTPNPSGYIGVDQVADSIREDTLLVSLMHVNNETGIMNPVAEIGELCRSRSVFFHVDAAQSAGKIDINVHKSHIDLLSLSAHKMYGPKGVGALYVRRSADLTLRPQIHGGGHERGMRSGTLPTHQIVGLGKAAEIARTERSKDFELAVELRQKLKDGIANDLDGIYFNECTEHNAPGIFNVSFSGVDGEVFLASLRKIAVSSGSACVSTSIEPSYVLTSMGVSEELAQASIRFSIGRFTSADEIEFTINEVVQAVNLLRNY